MYTFLKKIVIYGLASFIVLNLIAFCSLYFLGKSCFYKQQFVKNGVKETTFDYVVLGSSTGLTTLNTKLIDSITQKKGLNISIDDSGLSSHYLMLQHFYSAGKSTKKLILAVVPDDLGNAEPMINTNDYRFIPHIWNNDEVTNYFNQMNGKNTLLYKVSPYFPLIPVSYYNTELFYPGLLSILKPGNRYLFDDKGNFSYPNTSANKEIDNLIHRTKKVEFKNPYLTKIIDFCTENKIELLIYQSPIYKTSLVFPESIIVINHSDLINDKVYFYDQIHVNSKGRTICTLKFCESVFN
jgi:hypothetical protein